MREIKFRAWNDDRMYPAEEWPPSWVAVPVQVGEEEWVLEQHQLPKSQLMQFTGIKDKNGREIYEGDIVRYSEPTTYDDDREIVAEVQWGSKIPAFFPMAGYYIVDNGSLEDNTVDNYRLAFEVIGNIYENPELLTPQASQTD